MNIEILQNFIVFEGLDGAGTTTQSKKLSERLGGFHTFEPSDNIIGKMIRSILKGDTDITKETLVFLFAADRNQHVSLIRKFLDEGKTVVCDRYLFSSLAYQSLDVDFEKVFELNKSFPLPEHLFFIDTPIEECQRRINHRNQTKEIFEGIELQERILFNYNKSLKRYEDFGFKYHRLDGNLPVNILFEKEMEIIRDKSLINK